MLSLSSFNGEKADIRSLGVCLFAMIVDNLQFYEEKADNTIRRVKISDIKIPEFVSKETKYMI
jgi:hypothetical protein